MYTANKCTHITALSARLTIWL